MNRHDTYLDREYICRDSRNLCLNRHEYTSSDLHANFNRHLDILNYSLEMNRLIGFIGVTWIESYVISNRHFNPPQNHGIPKAHQSWMFEAMCTAQPNWLANFCLGQFPSWKCDFHLQIFLLFPCSQFVGKTSLQVQFHMKSRPGSKNGQMGPIATQLLVEIQSLQMVLF